MQARRNGHATRGWQVLVCCAWWRILPRCIAASVGILRPGPGAAPLHHTEPGPVTLLTGYQYSLCVSLPHALAYCDSTVTVVDCAIQRCLP